MLRHILIVSGYVLGAATIVVGTILLVAYGNGYTYDFKTGRLVHRGLVLLQTTPGDAQITVNGKEINKTTPYRNTYEGGSYLFTAAKEGYRLWQKQVEVLPSRVSHLPYVILIPERPQIETILEHSSITQAEASRDRKFTALNVASGAEAGIWVFDTQDRKQIKIYGLQPATEEKPAETAQILSWSDDASHLLIKSSVGDQASYLVLDADGNDSPINLTDIYRTDFPSLAFSPSNWQELYWVGPEGLRRLDLTNRTMSAVLAQKVAAFDFAGDRVIYIDNSKPQASLWYLERNGRKQRLIESLPSSSSYGLDYATYINEPQIAVAAYDSKTAVLYSNVFKDARTTTIPAEANRVVFNGDGRFILLTDGNRAITYDSEYHKQYDLNGQGGPINGISWFDNYHLQFNRGTDAILAEFDGNYAQRLFRNVSLPAFNASNTKSIYAVTPVSGGGFQVKAAKIRQ